MDNLLRDLKYAFRALVKKPGFTVVAVITLALGIGANTAIFSVVNAVLLSPLPYQEPDRLVMVWEDATFAGFPRNDPAPANFMDWKNQNQVFEDMAALAWSGFSLTGDGEPLQVVSFSVSANFFPLIGVQPALGRTFVPEDDQPGAHKVAIISYALWQSRYGGDPKIIDKDILLNGEKYTVVGVMPARFQFLNNYISLWVPLAYDQEMWANRGGHYMNVVARMKPGVSLQEAQADIQTIMQRISQQYPGESFDGKLGSVVLPLHEQLAGENRDQLIVLLVAVGFVLAIACANIAALLLARAASRRKEIAIRAALGASRIRVIRQLLTESLILSLTGGLAGLLLAVWSFDFLEKLIPTGMTLSTSLSIDWKMLAFTLLVSILTGVVFGLAPAIQASKVDLNEMLKQRESSTSSGAGGSRLRSALVVFEIAMALVLIVGTSLMIQTFIKLQGQYSFLQPGKILTMRTVLPRSKYDEAWKRTDFYNQVLERVKALPGVSDAGYTTSIPLSWKGGTSGFWPEGRQLIQGLSYDAIHRQITSDYLQTMGIPLLQGRYFDRTDNRQSMPVAIINETMARQYWPGESALDKKFKLGDPDSETPWMTVVGVVADVRQMGVDAPTKAEMYMPHQQMRGYPWFAPRDLAIRASGDPMSLTSAVSDEIHSIDPDQPIAVVSTMSQLLGEETEERHVGMILLATFAGLALLLATLGIYGVLAYFVTQRTHEIGVRMALGADKSDVMKMIVKQGMLLAFIGTIFGVIASLALTRLIESLLFGVSATDPLTFVVTSMLLAAVALLACYLPARRAMKVDPMVALRYE
jgi:putative ABC transport system permease protein